MPLETPHKYYNIYYKSSTTTVTTALLTRYNMRIYILAYIYSFGMTSFRSYRIVKKKKNRKIHTQTHCNCRVLESYAAGTCYKRVHNIMLSLSLSLSPQLYIISLVLSPSTFSLSTFLSLSLYLPLCVPLRM